MEIKFIKLNEDAVAPTRAHETDAGFDMTATSVKTENKFVEYGTGIAVNIPKGYVGLIFPRSSVTKRDLMLKNSVGVIDSGYQGEIRFRFKPFPEESFRAGNDIAYNGNFYEVGDRIGQIIFQKLPEVTLVEVESFEESERGDNGFGSTGN
jgi:dUTP pyrophosphatase